MVIISEKHSMCIVFGLHSLPMVMRNSCFVLVAIGPLLRFVLQCNKLLRFGMQ
jgi:hypothetical protein